MTPNIKQLHQYAQQALNDKQYQHAHGYLIEILQQDKYFADGYFLLGIIASDHGNNIKAIQLFEQALKLSENNTEYLAQLAKCFALEGKPVQAKKQADLACENIIINTNSSALTFDTLGVAYSKIGLHSKAVTLFKQAVAIQQNNPFYYFNLGVSQTFTGDFKDAQTSHEKVIALAPSYSKSYTALSAYGGVNSEHYNKGVLGQLFEKVSEPDDKLYIGHALAREYEHEKSYDLAYQTLLSAKQCKLDSLAYNFDEDKEVFDCLFETFSGINAGVNKNERIKKGHESDEPIFIVGMPRTGTTLVERILSQHSDVTTAGELDYFSSLFKQMSQTTSQRMLDEETISAAKNIDVEKLGKTYLEYTRVLTGNTAKFIDKMPLNVLYVGFILQVFPNAKIVCLDRNPLDTIMSNYRQLFSVNSYNYNYAYSLKTVAQYYVEFSRLADLWSEKYPNNFYQINYEALVNEPEIEAQKLVSFCGLGWQERCLAINNNTAPVATASAIQVRQPINNKSIDNWKKYDKHLSEVKEILINANLL